MQQRYLTARRLLWELRCRPKRSSRESQAEGPKARATMNGVSFLIRFLEMSEKIADPLRRRIRNGSVGPAESGRAASREWGTLGNCCSLAAQGFQ